MSLRLRLALAFAAVALLTGAAVSVAVPFVIGQGFARLQADLVPATTAPGTAGGRGAGGPPAGRGPATRAAQVQQDTTTALIVIALGAAGVASLAGVLVAGRLVRPLRRLEEAAAGVASGDLERRSGIAARGDEVGSLGRSFDRMASELARSEASRRRMLQDSAHELRTPLAVIDATASAVLDGVYSAEPRHLATIRDQARLLTRVVDDLRTIGLAEDRHLALRPEPVAATDLVGAAVAAFTARAAAAGISIEEAVDPRLWLNVDRDRAGQVLGALLDNAVRHTPPGRHIRVSAQPVGEVARLEVADDGPGIPVADLPHVFDRFYQADEARDRGRGGTGLGLAIARALVEAHGGTVSAMNAADGGACFRVELPRREGPGA